MIQLNRKDNRTLWLRFDAAGRETFVNALRQARNESSISIPVSIDPSVLSLKKKNLKQVEHTITISLGPSSTLSKLTTGILWTFEPDLITAAIEQFERCRKNGEFNPPEFVIIKTIKNRNLDHVYCQHVEV